MDTKAVIKLLEAQPKQRYSLLHFPRIFIRVKLTWLLIVTGILAHPGQAKPARGEPRFGSCVGGKLLDSQQPGVWKMTQFCVLQAKRCFQCCKRHIPFSLHFVEMLVQLFSAHKVGARPFLLASKKFQSCSAPHLSLNLNKRYKLIYWCQNKQNVDLEICWQLKS